MVVLEWCGVCRGTGIGGLRWHKGFTSSTLNTQKNIETHAHTEGRKTLAGNDSTAGWNIQRHFGSSGVVGCVCVLVGGGGGGLWWNNTTTGESVGWWMLPIESNPCKLYTLYVLRLRDAAPNGLGWCATRCKTLLRSRLRYLMNLFPRARNYGLGCFICSAFEGHQEGLQSWLVVYQCKGFW